MANDNSSSGVTKAGNPLVTVQFEQGAEVSQLPVVVEVKNLAEPSADVDKQGGPPLGMVPGASEIEEALPPGARKSVYAIVAEQSERARATEQEIAEARKTREAHQEEFIDPAHLVISTGRRQRSIKGTGKAMGETTKQRRRAQNERFFNRNFDNRLEAERKAMREYGLGDPDKNGST